MRSLVAFAILLCSTAAATAAASKTDDSGLTARPATETAAPKPAAPQPRRPAPPPKAARSAGQCVVADPTGTPLNVRDAPDGNLTGAALPNGTIVIVQGRARGANGRWWARISGGFVYMPYLRC